MAFWNVVGLVNKDQEFWRGMIEWEMATWVEKKNWSKIENRMPRGYKWPRQ